MTHHGLGDDIPLANNAVGATGRRIDVIVGGDSHTRLNRAHQVTHAGGLITHIVQADALGKFIGRIDLAVDPQTNTVTAVNSALVQVDNRFTEDPTLKARIEAMIQSPTGINQVLAAPLGITDAFDTILGVNQHILAGEISGASGLGSLTARSCRSLSSQPPYSINLDAVAIGNFTLRVELQEGPLSYSDIHACMPLHPMGRDGVLPQTIHQITFPGGVRQAFDPSQFPIPGPPLTGITTLEYFLESVYALDDILGGLGALLGMPLTGYGSYVQGLQWDGLELMADMNAPPMNRIDPASIRIGGLPLLGNENTTWVLGLDSIIARQALPLLRFILAVESPVGSGALVPFPDYDPIANDTGVIPFEALTHHVMASNGITPLDARVDGHVPRTRSPDLTLNPADVVVTPAQVAPGTTCVVSVPIVNIGGIAVTDATLDLHYDSSPLDFTDNPDGWTDHLTAFAWAPLALVQTGPIPAFGPPAGSVTLQINWMVPPSLLVGDYTIAMRVSGVISANAAYTERITGNNGGDGYSFTLQVR